MTKKSLNLTKYFLKNSQTNQHKNFTKILTVPQSHQILAPHSLIQQNYLSKYLEILGFMPSIKHNLNFTQTQLKKISANPNLYYSSSSQPQSQTAQLLKSINEVSNSKNDSLIPYLQLQQRLAIAKPETINQLGTKLTYLFKILLSKRDKLSDNQFQLELNIQLGLAIIKAFRLSGDYLENSQEWRKPQAIEKLLRARYCKNKGLNEVAMASFQQVFKDKAAQSNTRMQALKLICSQGQQRGDISVLQLLINESHESGESQFQEYIKQAIKKIKQGPNSNSRD